MFIVHFLYYGLFFSLKVKKEKKLFFSFTSFTFIFPSQRLGLHCQLSTINCQLSKSRTDRPNTAAEAVGLGAYGHVAVTYVHKPGVLAIIRTRGARPIVVRVRLHKTKRMPVREGRTIFRQINERFKFSNIRQSPI